jgi:hypothetical protein
MSAAQYLPSVDRTRAILEDLEAVRENLLALSDDIWAGIDRQDLAAFDEGVRFMRSYVEKMSEFDRLAAELSVLVQQYRRSPSKPRRKPARRTASETSALSGSSTATSPTRSMRTSLTSVPTSLSSLGRLQAASPPGSVSMHSYASSFITATRIASVQSSTTPSSSATAAITA